MSSIQQIISNAERLANRLKDRQALADAILVETEGVNNQLETMRQFKDDLDMLNSLAREKSNTQMIHTINQENPQIREMHSENIRLRASLEDHQRALEHIMSKYREHTQTAVMNTKLNFQEMFRGETEKNVLIKRQEEKIQEMIAVMQKAAALDDTYFEQNMNKDRENMSKLIIENQGLRELLQISKKFGTLNVMSDIDKVCVQTQTDTDLEAINNSNNNNNKNNSNVDRGGAKKGNANKKTASEITTTSAPPTKISNTSGSAAANSSKKNSTASNASSATAATSKISSNASSTSSSTSTTSTPTTPTTTSTVNTSSAPKVSSPTSSSTSTTAPKVATS